MRDGRTNERTREDRATQPMDAGWLSFAIGFLTKNTKCFFFCNLVRLSKQLGSAWYFGPLDPSVRRAGT